MDRRTRIKQLHEERFNLLLRIEAIDKTITSERKQCPHEYTRDYCVGYDVDQTYTCSICGNCTMSGNI